MTVLAEGYARQGRPYRSLSAIARAITGTRWNGPLLRLGGLSEARMTKLVRKIRCAVNTRKSSEEAPRLVPRLAAGRARVRIFVPGGHSS